MRPELVDSKSSILSVVLSKNDVFYYNHDDKYSEISPKYELYNFSETMTLISLKKIRREYFTLSMNRFEISSLDSKKYKLKSPIYFEIKKIDNEMVGLIPELDLHAFGSSIDEIVSELKMDIIDLFEFYNSVPWDELGEEPKKWKEFLLETIQVNG